MRPSEVEVLPAEGYTTLQCSLSNRQWLSRAQTKMFHITCQPRAFNWRGWGLNLGLFAGEQTMRALPLSCAPPSLYEAAFQCVVLHINRPLKAIHFEPENIQQVLQHSPLPSGQAPAYTACYVNPFSSPHLPQRGVSLQCRPTGSNCLELEGGPKEVRFGLRLFTPFKQLGILSCS